MAPGRGPEVGGLRERPEHVLCQRAPSLTKIKKPAREGWGRVLRRAVVRPIGSLVAGKDAIRQRKGKFYVSDSGSVGEDGPK